MRRREKLKAVEADAARAAETERERAEKSERSARRQAMQKVEMLNERTWAEAEALREQAVSAARAEAQREHKAALEALRERHEAERLEVTSPNGTLPQPKPELSADLGHHPRTLIGGGTAL